MPNRILREGIIESERVDQLSSEAEVFYRRLHSVVDDFGRYYSKPELLRARCFPLRLDRVKNEHITAWLGECVKAKLLRMHQSGVLELLDFNQQIRAKKSKYELPGDHQQRKR